MMYSSYHLNTSSIWKSFIQTPLRIQMSVASMPHLINLPLNTNFLMCKLFPLPVLYNQI